LLPALSAALLTAWQPTAPADQPPAGTPDAPSSAVEALDRAGAAYEFGDIPLMVNLSRLVAEGALPGDDNQRAEALRLLGIGLYISGSRDGAERVFADLVRLRPQTSLDPSVTRPEVVAFFRDVKRRNQPKKRLVLAFLPPFGQFQNDTPVRGWILAGLEVATFGVALTTKLVGEDWLDANLLCRGSKDPTPCQRLKVLNYASVGALTATWLVGVVDALVGMRTTTEVTTPPRASLTILPNGAAVRLSF
jgi:hypothetical protein